MRTVPTPKEEQTARLMVAQRERSEAGSPSNVAAAIMAIPRIGWVLVLGAVLRIITLGRQSLWLDEAISYWTVNRPFPVLLEYLSTHPRPLHFLVLYPMVVLGGEEWMLRLPSALVGIASIGVMYAIGAELFDRRTGLIVSLILALSPFHIWYSQEARFYAMLAFLGLAAAWFAMRALRRNRPVDWIFFGLFEGLALGTESGGVWLVFGVNFAALLMSRSLWRTGRIFSWAASQAIALLIYLPVLPYFLQAMGGDNTLWIPPATFIQLARTVADFSGSFMRTTIESRLVMLVLLAGIATGAPYLVQEIRWGKGFQLERYLFLLSWLVVPLSISFLISQRYVSLPFFSIFFNQDRSVFLTRNLILASFPLYLLLARSLVLGRRPWGMIVLAALILLNTYAYFGNAVLDRKEDYRNAAALLMDEAGAQDLILFAPPFLETPFAYYYYPVDQLLDVGYERAELEDGVISTDLRRTYAAPIEAVSEEQEVWLVYNENEFQPDNKGTREALGAWGNAGVTWQFEGVIVQRYTAGE
jgi:4-amino-4-deoxy-L-arabinose transferase-like glycosyltransferase